MLKRLIIIISLLWIVNLVSAQDDFTETHVFVDGTVVNHPIDYRVIFEDYDEAYLVNDTNEIRIFITYERTILSRELESLPEILEWWWGDGTGYEIGDEDEIIVGDREGIEFTYENSDDVDVRVIVFPVGDNGSVAIVSLLPNVEEGSEELEDEGVVFGIVETIHWEDLGSSFETVLGNSFVVDASWLVEYNNDWLVNTTNQTLTRTVDSATMTISIYSAEEITALDLKNDPIELLYYDMYAPVDDTIEFNPENISFINIRGLEGIRYALLDTVDEERIQRVYFLASLNEDDVLAIEVVAPVGTNVLRESDVQDIIQTIRPEGTLPPIEMMPLDSVYILPDVGEVRFPVFWRARENDNGIIILSTLDTFIFIEPISSAVVEDNGYADDLTATLLDFLAPEDDSVVINPDDIETGALQNGNRYAQTTYIETDDLRSYPRTEMVMVLDDNSILYISYGPQPGIDEVVGSNLNEVLAILNTISPQ